MLMVSFFFFFGLMKSILKPCFLVYPVRNFVQDPLTCIDCTNFLVRFSYILS